MVESSIGVELKFNYAGTATWVSRALEVDISVASFLKSDCKIVRRDNENNEMLREKSNVKRSAMKRDVHTLFEGSWFDTGWKDAGKCRASAES
ncbi:hypothetical protein SUGI_0841920 [Cryptomeria japonica]|nr:hypothetical protein SUGI_0841920 [Cryptomeria japonica]